jgi:DNA-binding transcriptional ArsR family regulator
MSIILKKDVRINHVITTSVERSKALEDEARATMLNILSHKQMTAEDLVRELKKNGYGKATTTVRHHLDILRDCGLVEVTKMQEVRGAVLKYYASTAKFLGFQNSFDPNKYSKAINETSSKLLKIAFAIMKCDFKDVGARCQYCNMQHGKEYVILEIMNLAMAEMVQKKEFVEMMNSHK